MLPFISQHNPELHREHIARGLPQGSVLGPILFNLYTNDSVHVSDEFRYVLFADDTNIL